MNHLIIAMVFGRSDADFGDVAFFSKNAKVGFDILLVVCVHER
jgi:hypothetical protein